MRIQPQRRKNEVTEVVEKGLFSVIVCLFLFLLTAYCLFPLEYVTEINDAAREFNLPPSLIAAVIKMESDYDPLAVSSTNAFGLMQLMPDTASWLKKKYITSASWRSPDGNITLGSYYLKMNLNDFEGDLSKALSAYHAGPARTKRRIADNTYTETLYARRVKLYKMVYEVLYDAYLLKEE